MALDKRKREEILAHCGELRDDDGIDPRTYFKAGSANKRVDRKAWQLCRQVAETLDQVLAGEVRDDVLRALRVASVQPAPDSSRLLVTLHVDSPPADFDRSVVEERLAHFRGRLRSEVAAAITRRKTPALVYAIIGPGGASGTRRNEVES